MIVASFPASGQTLFAAIGDYGDGFSNERDIAGLVNGWNPGRIITMGDNHYGSKIYDETVGQDYCDYLSGVGSGSYCSGSNIQKNAFFPRSVTMIIQMAAGWMNI